ncbi:AraC family transcriptional regulator, partial [Pseudomonas gessardii]
MRETDSVAAYFMFPMIHALREKPQRLRSILEQVGIDPALLGQPTARVPAKAFAALWLVQIRELNDEFFQLDAHGMPPGSFALICRALIQEPTLEKAMRQCLANFALFLGDYRGTLTV